METRANYILIGLFTLFGVFGALGFFIWLAKIEVDRQYAYYDILFESVSGLDRAADVQFSGLSVGKVISLGLFHEDPSKVMVRIEIAAETPIKTDTRAQLQSQGVTGVAFVALAGGSQSADLLIENGTTAVPMIAAERSVVQALTADAPDLLAEAVNLMRRMERLVSDENLAHVSAMLADLDQTVDALPQLAAQAEQTLVSASETMIAVDTVLVELRGAVGAAQTAIDAVTRTIETSNALLETTAGPALADLQKAAKQFDLAMSAITADAPAIAAQVRSTLETASSAINRINTTVAASAPPFRSFAETGLPQYTRLARETRDLVESVSRLITRMERDPARFFFGNNVPELRR